MQDLNEIAQRHGLPKFDWIPTSESAAIAVRYGAVQLRRSLAHKRQTLDPKVAQANAQRSQIQARLTSVGLTASTSRKQSEIATVSDPARRRRSLNLDEWPDARGRVVTGLDASPSVEANADDSASGFGAIEQERAHRIGERVVLEQHISRIAEYVRHLEKQYPVPSRYSRAGGAVELCPLAQVSSSNEILASTGLRRRIAPRGGADEVDVTIEQRAQEVGDRPVALSAWRVGAAWGTHLLVSAAVQFIARMSGSLVDVVVQQLPEAVGCIGGYLMVPLSVGASSAYLGRRMARYFGFGDRGRQAIWMVVSGGVGSLLSVAGLFSMAELMAEQPTPCLIVMGGAIHHIVLSWIEAIVTDALRDCGPRPLRPESAWMLLMPLASCVGSLSLVTPLALTYPIGSLGGVFAADTLGAIGHASGQTWFLFWIANRDVRASREIVSHRAWMRTPHYDDIVMRGTAGTGAASIQILVAGALQQAMRAVVVADESGYPIANMMMGVIVHDVLRLPLELSEAVRMRSGAEAPSVELVRYIRTDA